MACDHSGDRPGDIPARVAARPTLEQWGLDELMTLSEAAVLHFGVDGPLTERSLRTAADDGVLPVALVARKLLTTRRAMLELSKCKRRSKRETVRDAAAPPSGRSRFRRDAENDYARLMAEINSD